ncbi:hypothetical protein KTE26_21910 [Ralstonia mannitolilytica]|uniref:hypothetical protein n=1 Tax=Ralstonia mannitolilytica TaxID=105219 RepID=UPI001C22DEC9|nr:hypothetical protein [Ralstonia mannitolilytica]MBU9581093.1 hypothetical protein [Ralstonia mannitolilytica]
MEELYLQSKPFNAADLQHELDEILWRGAEPGSPEEEEQARKRLSALGWALQELGQWTPQPPLGLYRLQILLTTLLVSSHSDEEATEVVPQELILGALGDGLVLLLNAINMSAQRHRHHFGYDQLHEETLVAGRNGDYRKLGNLIRHLEIELPPDARLAIMLLARSAPDRLARHIEERQDVHFSVAVRDALTAGAAQFALSVDDVTFKFICASPLADARVTDAPEDSVQVIRALLLQVARTDSWRSWLLDFARYPHLDTVAERALSETLTQLTPAHWAAYVNAVELWTHAPTAAPVAKILVPFFEALGEERSADMWRLAFERWDRWDYGSHEKGQHLLAPSACSFDFPVAMHYAFLPLAEVQAEEARLQESISTGASGFPCSRRS